MLGREARVVPLRRLASFLLLLLLFRLFRGFCCYVLLFVPSEEHGRGMVGTECGEGM